MNIGELYLLYLRALLDEQLAMVGRLAVGRPVGDACEAVGIARERRLQLIDEHETSLWLDLVDFKCKATRSQLALPGAGISCHIDCIVRLVVAWNFSCPKSRGEIMRENLNAFLRGESFPAARVRDKVLQY